MSSTRRDFIKVGAAGATLLGFDITPAFAESRALKISRTTETRSTCPYCSVSCGVIIHTEGDKSRNVKPFVVHVEGDPDHPINQGSLCSKGITLKSNIVNDRRLTKVMYRAPGSDKWEEKSWDFAIDRIARLMKDSRDGTFIEKDAQGHSVNALTAVGVIGGCTDIERKQLPAEQSIPGRDGGHPTRTTGPYLTWPHGGQFGRHFRSRSDDQWLERHRQCRCHPRHGRKSRRESSRRIPLG